MYRIVIIFFIINACSSKPSPFGEVTCSDSLGYRVFKPCRMHTFVARYWDHGHNSLSQENIYVLPTGNPWSGQPDRQKEIMFQYEYDESMIDSLEKYNLNPQLGDWASGEVTGIIETDNEIWMHPFRQNQYLFMEVAPFPCVQLPLEVGSSWTRTLTIHNWGVWSNSTVESTYEVVGMEQLSLPVGDLEVWKIMAVANASYGSSTLTYWFHPELGFVKMIVYNYAGQTLEIELTDTQQI